MTRTLHAMRRQPIPTDVLAPRNGVMVPQVVVRLTPVHVVACDECGAEHHNLPAEAYETYLPYDWMNMGRNRHRCPACRDQEALGAEQKARAEWIDSGLTVAEVRERLDALHKQEAEMYGSRANRGRRRRT